MTGTPPPSLTRSVQIVLNNYPQRRKKKKPVRQITLLLSPLGLQTVISLLIQPSLLHPAPGTFCGYGVNDQTGKGTCMRRRIVRALGFDAQNSLTS